jgi:hypothetical protein
LSLAVAEDVGRQWQGISKTARIARSVVKLKWYMIGEVVWKMVRSNRDAEEETGQTAILSLIWFISCS